ncbi:MAG: glucuronate isomerase [Bacteroidota bacterium]
MIQTSTFIHEDFLLTTGMAKLLYHDYLRGMPIIDYHCHLSPKDLAENRQFENITEAWLEGDHYKWRAMRTHGVNERFITGSASDWEKFQQYAETVPYTLRNPLYHWTHMELNRPFGIQELLTPDTAESIYYQTQAYLQSPEGSTHGILSHWQVKLIGTTDDPTDDLRYHQQLQAAESPFQLLPTFRPDKAFAIEEVETYNAYVDSLGEAAGIEINSYTTLIEALHKRAAYFHEHGCRLSDHGLEYIFGEPAPPQQAANLFSKVRSGTQLSPLEADALQSSILLELGKMYHELGWTQQFHLGALRNNNSRMMQQLGPDTGFDSIGDFPQARPLAAFLNRLDQSDQLAQTILYNLNPADNEVFATMVGNFNDGSTAGKVQWGSAWWFLDQYDGMEKQINALSNMGLIAHFVGMLTDSRSVLSYSRHDYFRRLLCNLFADDITKGRLPSDLDWIGKVLQDITFNNSNTYFNWKNPAYT